MDMQMKFYRKLPTPQELKEEFPIDDHIKQIKEERDQQIADIFTGKDDRFLLIIGPCSADNEAAVLDYINRLAKTAEQVKDKIFIIPRVYTNKPRTTGMGYKGMLHQPDPDAKEDMLAGLIAIREMHKEMGSMAVRAVDRYNASERYFTGMTIGVNEETYSRIVDEINICAKKIAAIANESDNLNQVYGLNLQLFPFTNKIEGESHA